MNCAKTIEVIQTAIELRENRYKRANFLLKCLENIDFEPQSYKDVIEKLFSYHPSESWLTNFAKSNDIVIKNATIIEDARRKHCNYKTVGSFYSKH